MPTSVKTEGISSKASFLILAASRMGELGSESFLRKLEPNGGGLFCLRVIREGLDGEVSFEPRP